ncbi:MAG TPA: arabinogalactan endo-1,4-beta-galactosidase [Bacteroidetes bacterium]|nr:arabinogalactan endo-1,4-beta-galactosidase [Bacteroidota bacterium]
MKYAVLHLIPILVLTGVSCKQEEPEERDDPVFYMPHQMVMGADLSYVNQILDHNGSYRDSGKTKNPYRIFPEYGANVARFRLFHTPEWTKEIYGEQGTRMYNDLDDVTLAVARAREQGMQVCLDFHYSDTWADPSRQLPPAAWEGLSLEILHDSIYRYTLNVLQHLGQQDLMPEYVQTGNEINPGFLLPAGNRWDGNEENFVYLLNAGIQAVRDAGHNASPVPKIILHIAQPENVVPWFQGLEEAGLKDFDIVGFSYYYMWSEVELDRISNFTEHIRLSLGREVMIMETAYPWTTGYADDYPNIIDTTRLESGYPATAEGQYRYLVKLTQEVIDGGGKGIFYWEPAWITSGMKTQWGQGSAWECNTLFDFGGNVLPGMQYMTFPYTF